MNIYHSNPCEGVCISACRTDKFKSALLTVSFALPLDVETASGYSLLTNLLSLSTGDYPSMQSFSVAKDDLYALGLDAYVQRRGEILLMTFEINTIADSFALDGEKVLLRACEILSGAIFRPNLKDGLFPSETVETEKLCLIEEIASEIENKPSYALKRARRILCEGEPFAVDAGGEIERVKALTSAQLMEFYRTAIETAPVFIVYSGEADDDYLEECVRTHLPFAGRSNMSFTPVVHIPRDSVLRVVENMDMEQSVLVLGFTLEMPKSAHDRAVLSVYDEIFGGSSTSKLFTNVREKEGLCYYCSSYPSGRKNVLFVTCGLEPGNEQYAIDAIYKEVESMMHSDFTDDELENAKNSILRSLNSVSGSLGSLNGYLLGQALLDDSVPLEENIRLVSGVTREDVTALAKTVKPELEYILCEEDA